MKNKNAVIVLLIPVIVVVILLLVNNAEVGRVPEAKVSEESKVLNNMGDNAKDIIESSESSSAKEISENPTVRGAATGKEENGNTVEVVTLHTSAGDMVIKLHTKETPKTAANFGKLAQNGFYDGTIFHRVIKDFMIQGGDPTGTGSGGPGYTIEDEAFEGEYTRGTLAMANTGRPNSAGSQFFILHKDYPLPKSYVIFGKVTSGLETLDKIAEAPVTRSAMGELSTPAAPVEILSATIGE
jgi:cyclophilin family peptidyl-prolyl cis-trans isomerase